LTGANIAISSRIGFRPRTVPKCVDIQLVIQALNGSQFSKKGIQLLRHRQQSAVSSSQWTCFGGGSFGPLMLPPPYDFPFGHRKLP
jgi:hypothetical protein